jgi:hypothetical protein
MRWNRRNEIPTSRESLGFQAANFNPPASMMTG